MVTQLINASIIWLSSLLVYELLLKRETFHRLNRGYMLLTFAAGVLLPLMPWEQSVLITTIKSDVHIVPSVLSNQKPGIATIIPSAAGTQDYKTKWWLILYLTGVAAGILYLLSDLLRLWLLYRRSTIHREGRWLIAETGRAHGPFSMLHILFITDRQSYTDQQWQMILQHEQQHHRSGHIIDLAFMQAAVILLWFHPLVYIYRYKLRLLHEYEADSRKQEDMQTYGRFLLEQAVLGRPAPVIAHSFSHSPLKNRIEMMTGKTSKAFARWRFLLLLPMFCVFILCCTQRKENSAIHTVIDINGRYATRHDVHLAYSRPTPADTLKGPDGIVFATLDATALKLNNQDVLETSALIAAPRCTYPGKEFGIRYVLQQTGLEKVLQKMPDGKYFMALSDIIVDPSGRIVYYMLTFPENWEGMTSDVSGINYAKPNGLTDADKNEIQKKISTMLIGGGVAFEPVKNKQGNPIPFYLEHGGERSTFELRTMIQVRSHKISFPGA